jgi:hypothetical protein
MMSIYPHAAAAAADARRKRAIRLGIVAFQVETMRRRNIFKTIASQRK